MRLPNRKPGKYTFPTFDSTMTAEKLKDLQTKLERVKKALPQAIKETQQYGENGDFSENAEYQIAKGRLRGLNRAVTELQYQIAHAQVIQAPTDTTTVQVGHTVTLTVGNQTKTFTILGSSETNPGAGIISYQSPLGAALLGHQLGETVSMQVGSQTVTCTILEIQQRG